MTLDQFIFAAAMAAAALLATWLLWVFFLAVMHLQEARNAGRLTTWNTRIGYSVLFVGYLLDFIVNMTFAVLLFLELPRETTVSARIERLVLYGTGWRQTVAIWVRRTLLATFDPSGRHG